MVIAVDFDGTVVRHEYPEVGADVPGAVETLKELALHGNQIILYTMRGGDELKAAVQWYIDRGIALYSVNRNPEQDWTVSPKCYAQLYIDDAALGCPLTIDDPDEPNAADRPFVDWDAVRKMLEVYGILPPKPEYVIEIP